MTDIVPHPFTLRDSCDEDIAAIQSIYAHHVATGTASFEYESPSPSEMAARRAHVLEQGFPYIVAVNTDGEVVGYAYASLFRTRTAYRFTVEDSIYLRPDWSRRGVGKALLSSLIARCEGDGLRQMVAVIGGSDNLASIALHRTLGFDLIGTMPGTGFKFGRWIDTILMQRTLGEGSASCPGERLNKT